MFANVCQDQDKFVAGEAMTDKVLYPAIFHIVTHTTFAETRESHCKYDSYAWELIIGMSLFYT